MTDADVKPVKRGRWICPVSVGNGIKFCSVCHNEAYWDTDYGQQLFDYCPYCGARMDDEIMTDADVKPVKHGRWSECYTDSRLYSGICTVCGKASIRSIKENPLEYCPKCGARMDGDTF